MLVFFPHDLDDHRCASDPVYGLVLTAEQRALDDGPAVADYARRDYRLIAGCRHGHRTPVALSHSLLDTPARWLHRWSCPRCGAEPLHVAELIPPGDVDGLPLEDPGAAFDAIDDAWPDDLAVADGGGDGFDLIGAELEPAGEHRQEAADVV